MFGGLPEFVRRLADDEDRSDQRTAVEQRREHPLMFGKFDDHRHRIGVGEDVLEFGGCVPVVDVDRHGADLDEAEDARDVLDAVLQEQRHVIAHGDPFTGEELRRAVCLGFQLRVREVQIFVGERDAIRHRGGDRLENIREVELHRDSPSCNRPSPFRRSSLTPNLEHVASAVEGFAPIATRLPAAGTEPGGMIGHTARVRTSSIRPTRPLASECFIRVCTGGGADSPRTPTSGQAPEGAPDAYRNPSRCWNPLSPRCRGDSTGTHGATKMAAQLP